MKQFFKYVLATVTGMIIVTLLGFLLLVLGIINMGKKNIKLEENTVLEINLNGMLSERTQNPTIMSMIGGSATENISLENMLKAIQRAKTEAKIKGIYIQSGTLTGATPGMLEEIRDALVDFKRSGKFILAYGDNYSQGTYYIASAADKVVINPYGHLDWQGLSFQTMYFKDLLDKLGVEVEVFKVGTYKSAVEPFILSEMSDANREQIETFSNEIWNRLKYDIGKSRSVSMAKLEELADSMMTFQTTSAYQTAKLVDATAYSDEVPSMISSMLGEENSSYNTISVSDLAEYVGSKPKGTSGNVIAVYYAYGDIVEAPGGGLLGSDDEIVGSKVSKDLMELANDDNVKAVVLRVNSGGGSAYASEQIWHAVEQVKQKKPVVVSMGGLAASGGYYISCGADWIVSESTTLTGSIGIFGMFPVAKELINDKLGINFETVKTNEYADFGDFSREMSDGEKTRLQNYIDRGYELFTQRCADGREMSQDSIKVIGEGRVWTGAHALRLGLVDELGDLQTAIWKASELSKTDSYTVMNYPEQKGFWDSVFNNDKQNNSYASKKFEEALGDFYVVVKSIRHLNPHGSVQAEMPYKLRFNL